MTHIDAGKAIISSISLLKIHPVFSLLDTGNIEKNNVLLCKYAGTKCLDWMI
jgi:hypothetical protein